MLGLIRLRSIRATRNAAHALLWIRRRCSDELGVSADVRFSDEVDRPGNGRAAASDGAAAAPRADLALTVQQAVLCHELIHVQRRDWCRPCSKKLWCAVLWFHPAARALAARLNLARETLVDEATIAYTRDRRA